MRAALLAVALVSACASPTASVSELKDAVPREAQLSLALRTSAPTSAPTCPSLGPSSYGPMTHDVSGAGDGVLADVMGLVDALTAQPAAASEPGQAMWGPIEGATSVYTLAVHQTDATAFEFFLGGEPEGAGDAWQGVFGGTSVVADARHRSGEVDVNLTVMHQLDPTGDLLEGGIAVQYVEDDAGRAVTAHFGGIVTADEPQPADTHYELVEKADGTAEFAFARNLDVDGGGVADEVIQVTSRWAADGSGVAAVVVTGGSLGQREVTALECWDPSFGVVYAEDGQSGGSVGSKACCPF